MQGLGTKAAGGDKAAPSEQEMEILEESSDEGQESEEEDAEEGLDPDEDRRCGLLHCEILQDFSMGFQILSYTLLVLCMHLKL